MKYNTVVGCQRDIVMVYKAQCHYILSIPHTGQISVSLAIKDLTIPSTGIFVVNFTSPIF